MESFMIRSSHCRSNNYDYHKAIEEEENGILPSLSQLPNSSGFRRKMSGSRTTAAIMRSDDATMKKVVAAPKRQQQPPPSEDINESAEAFIKKFRQQLLIQRLESIENYEKMLARGT